MTDVEIVQDAWHDCFGGDLVPSDDAAQKLIIESGDIGIVLESIIICADKKDDITLFEARYAYIRGIIRNKRIGEQIYKRYDGKRHE